MLANSNSTAHHFSTNMPQSVRNLQHSSNFQTKVPIQRTNATSISNFPSHMKLLPGEAKKSVTETHANGKNATNHRSVNNEAQTNTEGFISNGTINSIIKTPAATWIAIGNWNMNSDNDTVKLFRTDMKLLNSNGNSSGGMVMANDNGGMVMAHEFQNFRPINGGNMSGLEIHPGSNIIAKGVMDVGTNHLVVWRNVPATIVINGGRTIAISVDDNATNHHFAGQKIYGLVTSFVSK